MISMFPLLYFIVPWESLVTRSRVVPSDVTTSMASTFSEKRKYNVIPIPTIDLREERKEHDSPKICQMLKPEVSYFLADTAVFQDWKSGA